MLYRDDFKAVATRCCSVDVSVEKHHCRDERGQVLHDISLCSVSAFVEPQAVSLDSVDVKTAVQRELLFWVNECFDQEQKPPVVLLEQRSVI